MMRKVYRIHARLDTEKLKKIAAKRSGVAVDRVKRVRERTIVTRDTRHAVGPESGPVRRTTNSPAAALREL